MAERAARKYSSEHIFEYLELNEDYGIYEISTSKEWVGKSIREINFRVKYNLSILGYKVGEKLSLHPSADHVFEAGQHLIVIGRMADIDKIIKKM
jgi:trk system potassium uptake protein TrkA